MTLNTNFDKLLDFPSILKFKIMGITHPDLIDQVLNTLQQLAPDDYAPTVTPSSKGTYQSLSVPVTVTDKEHIEQIYSALNKLDLVKYIL